MLKTLDASSTRPYLLRALHEWCTDNGYTPYVAVLVDETVQVPVEYVKNGEIVLNVCYDATADLIMGNEFIEFKARFAGVSREIMVPMNRVLAIYARENGQGISFPIDKASALKSAKPISPARGVLNVVEAKAQSDKNPDDMPPTPSTPSGRPALKRVK